MASTIPASSVIFEVCLKNLLTAKERWAKLKLHEIHQALFWPSQGLWQSSGLENVPEIGGNG